MQRVKAVSEKPRARPRFSVFWGKSCPVKENFMMNCSIIGATSYTAGELIRLLAGHPHVEFGCLTTRGEEKIPARNLVPALGKRDDLFVEPFDFEKVIEKSDVIFLTLPHTSAMEFVPQFYKKKKIVIDLSADFRLKNFKTYEKWYGLKHTGRTFLKHAVYGLPELYREEIRKSNLIANPGCYPTGAALGLIPLLQSRLIGTDSIVIDAKSGVSGAGKKLSDATHFVEVNENFNAYKVNKHQHAPEIEQTLSETAGSEIKITFVPHLLPITRGILSTIYAEKKKNVKKEHIVKAFEEFSETEPFVRFLGADAFPALKNVQYTNFCDIGVTVDEVSGRVIVITAIDNLLKGASSQAIQNMNIRLGFEETMGLVHQ